MSIRHAQVLKLLIVLFAFTPLTDTGLMALTDSPFIVFFVISYTFYSAHFVLVFTTKTFMSPA